MRALVACVPQTGHVAPLLPLAQVMAARGDEVLVASGPEAGDAVRTAGLPFRETGPSFESWFGELQRRVHGTPGDGLRPEQIERYFIPRLFGEVGTLLVLDDLLAAAEEHRPDAVVFDPYLFAGPLVATRLGAVPVLHTISVLNDPAVIELVAEAMSPPWRELGLDVPPDAGLYAGTTVSVCPPSLDPRVAELERRLPLRPAPLPSEQAPPPAEVPSELWDRPVVYVTLGTFSSSNLGLFRLLIEAVSELPVNAVVTTGQPVPQESLGPVPEGVHVASYVPQAELLPHCAAVVHHAGAGTTFGVLAHGLPSVTLPQSADNFIIADRLVAADATVALQPEETTAASVRETLTEILDAGTEGPVAAGARRLADEIATMPGPDEVAQTLASELTGPTS